MCTGVIIYQCRSGCAWPVTRYIPGTARSGICSVHRSRARARECVMQRNKCIFFKVTSRARAWRATKGSRKKKRSHWYIMFVRRSMNNNFEIYCNMRIIYTRLLLRVARNKADNNADQDIIVFFGSCVSTYIFVLEGSGRTLQQLQWCLMCTERFHEGAAAVNYHRRFCLNVYFICQKKKNRVDNVVFPRSS